MKDALISLFSSAFESEPQCVLTMSGFIADVQRGRWADDVSVLRRHLAAGDRKRYDDRKRSLPGVTLSAVCLSRATDLDIEAKCIRHSGWLQADFDGKDNGHLEDADVLSGLRIALLNDPHVGAVFVGPSGSGLKAVVRIDPERHRDSWFAAEAYFLEKFGLKLDKSTKDPLRLCFVSHDPLAELRGDEPEILPVPDVAARGSNDDAWHPPIETTAADIKEMLAHVPSRPDYDVWLRVASAVWSVLPAADGARLLNEWSPEEKEGEYMRKHGARLLQVGIGTLVHYAVLNGFDAAAAWKRKRWAGRIRFADSAVHPANAEAPGNDTALPGVLGESEIERPRVMDAFNNGQLGDARLWTHLRRGMRVFNIHADLWMIYDDGVWKRDEGRSTITDVSDSLCGIYQGVVDSIASEMRTTPAPDGKKDPRAKETAGLLKRHESLRNRNYLRNVELLATATLQLPATSFDCHPNLLAVENGVIDFAEGVFREHRPADYLTHRTPVRFDVDATCPHWDAFIDFFMAGDRELIEYLARAVGLSLTGYVNEDVLFFCYGKGANGKSTFMAALKMLLGDLMTTVPMNALLSDKSDNNYDYQKANMEGRRIVVTDEIPEGKRLAEERIKQIIGGDEISARRPFEKPYNFKPTHKLWLVGNHKPDIRGTDHGMWRRISLIPWNVTMPEEKRRARHDVLAEFRAELSGILNWAVRGYLDLQGRGGLKAPASVTAATEEYKSESDQFAQFLAECTVKNNLGKTKIKTLLRTYQAWCEENGEPCRYSTSKRISNYLREHGWETMEDGHDKAATVLGMELNEAQTTPELGSNIVRISE